jgi:phosphate transport system substrate-binding protein
LKRNVLSRRVSAGVIVAVLALAGCSSRNNSGDNPSGANLSGAIRVDGSSTTGPLTEEAAAAYREQQPGVNITVGISGTGAGFEKFCNDETDIQDASRTIKDEEKAACTAKNIEYFELLVANDALSVVVNPSNDWATCLTVDQLKKVWDQGSTVTNWNQVDPSFPDKPLGEKQLFGAGTDSGTFDYFTEEINGEPKRSRTNYTPSENDNVLVQGVEAEANAMGYFGYSYLVENPGKLKALEIDGGSGCVPPSPETVADGTYTPLARPLLIYVKKSALSRPEVVDFVKYYVENIEEITDGAGFVPLTAEQKTKLTTDHGLLKP